MTTGRKAGAAIRWSLIGAGVAVAAAVALYFGLPFLLYTAEHEPPLNTVVISDRLASSGQPSATQLRRLRAQGYEAVINLAPPDAYGSVAGEAEIVRQEGLVYHNIPVDWERPTVADFERFRTVLDGLRGRTLWVHCQMNMRASVFVFLHRVLDERVAPTEASAAVHAVWVPNATWREFAQAVLARHGVAFDPDLLR